MPLEAYPRLATEADLALAIDALTRKCRVMRAVYSRTGLPPLRDYPANFEGLARIVVGQQLSAASAGAIWSRVSTAVKPFGAPALLSQADADLKKLGLSNGKIRTLRAIAAAVRDEQVSFKKINKLPDADVHEHLTALHGVGPWTADIYLLFALRRADAFPSGDLALQLATKTLFDLKSRPLAHELEAVAERWRPWRGAAARLLWAHYALAGRQNPVGKQAQSPKRG